MSKWNAWPRLAVSDMFYIHSGPFSSTQYQMIQEDLDCKCMYWDICATCTFSSRARFACRNMCRMICLSCPANLRSTECRLFLGLEVYRSNISFPDWEQGAQIRFSFACCLQSTFRWLCSAKESFSGHTLLDIDATVANPKFKPPISMKSMQSDLGQQVFAECKSCQRAAQRGHLPTCFWYLLYAWLCYLSQLFGWLRSWPLLAPSENLSTSRRFLRWT